MLDAVVDMVSQSASGCLKEVRIIIFQQAMMKDFISRMEKKAGSDKHNISLFGKLRGKQLNKYALKQGSSTYGTCVKAGTYSKYRYMNKYFV